MTSQYVKIINKKSLYLLKTKNYFKIGVSLDPKCRIKELQTGCPEKIMEIKVYPELCKYEKEIHKQLKKFASGGGTEWFEINGLDEAIIIIENYNFEFKQKQEESDKLIVTAYIVIN